MAHTWVPTSVFPQLLPWLALLGLLAIPRNRNAAAWWIWAPIACAFAFQGLLGYAEGYLPGQPLEILGDAVKVLSFGLSFLWLISTTAARTSRFKTFLFVLLVVGGLGTAAYLLSALQEQSMEMLFQGILVLMCGIIIPAALSLAGVLCHRRYRPAALVLWSCLSVILFSLMVVAPLLLFALYASPGSFAWAEFLLGTGLLAGFSFAILLPFLVLAYGNTLFRERLKSLLQLAESEKPAMIALNRPLEMEVR